MVGSLLAACGGDDGSEGSGSTKVRFAMTLPVPAAYQAYFTSVPEELGYFEDEGLEIEYLPFDGSSASLTAVDAGQADLASTATLSVAVARSAGADLKIFQTNAAKNVFAPAVPEDSPIQSIDEFAGKKIGIQGLEAAAYQVLRGILVSEGVDVSDIEWVTVGAGAEAIPAIESKKIDLFAGATQQYDAIEAASDLSFRRIPSEVADRAGWISGFAARADYLKDSDTAARFMRAVAKARIFTIANPEAAADIHYKAYPESKPTGVSDDEAIKIAVTALKSELSNHSETDGVWGMADPEQVKATLDVYLAGEVIKEPLTVDDMYDGSLVDSINDFDAEAIRLEAKEAGK